MQRGFVARKHHGTGIVRAEMSKKRIPRPKSGRSQDFPLDGEKLCVWMKAGVVNFKLCDGAYNCLACSFDRAMREAWPQYNGRKETDE
ncbi:hypothetical protein [Syntrophobacter fumaroxidans]|uniref:Uncharacterized protein n=1 Tax=Syntrophobacter fumaroxidans (strain DSM 10017 / MPOB) TaxID=335543 RepID=A0LGH0_SYNFM|nr:hypothetical protein [Syntrophobacter fumaroxidans]ABK16522.1 hypothetical protein Sfum_0825 [Syntrophobacter fumaroxidans MPOB]